MKKIVNIIDANSKFIMMRSFFLLYLADTTVYCCKLNLSYNRNSVIECTRLQ